MRNKKGSIVSFVSILWVIIAAWYISGNHYQLMIVQGNSMLPSYHNMQIVLLDKNSTEYGYGDVIAFKCESLDAVLVKRVVACPGDIVLIKDATLYVNGEKSTVFSQVGAFQYSGIAGREVLLQNEQYFVIGDNVSESKDSRYQEVGCVHRTEIRGKVIQ